MSFSATLPSTLYSFIIGGAGGFGGFIAKIVGRVSQFSLSLFTPVGWKSVIIWFTKSGSVAKIVNGPF